MNPVVTPLHPLFVAKITGVELVRRINEATPRAIERSPAALQRRVARLPDRRGARRPHPICRGDPHDLDRRLDVAPFRST